MYSRVLNDIQTRMVEAIKDLYRSPSQLQIFLHFIYMDRPLTPKMVAEDLGITPKSAERAIDKLFRKDLIMRSPLLKGHYICDVRRIIPCILLMLQDLYKSLEKREEKRKS